MAQTRPHSDQTRTTLGPDPTTGRVRRVYLASAPGFSTGCPPWGSGRSQPQGVLSYETCFFLEILPIGCSPTLGAGPRHRRGPHSRSGVQGVVLPLLRHLRDAAPDHARLPGAAASRGAALGAAGLDHRAVQLRLRSPRCGHAARSAGGSDVVGALGRPGARCLPARRGGSLDVSVLSRPRMLASLALPFPAYCSPPTIARLLLTVGRLLPAC